MAMSLLPKQIGVGCRDAPHAIQDRIWPCRPTIRLMKAQWPRCSEVLRPRDPPGLSLGYDACSTKNTDDARWWMCSGGKRMAASCLGLALVASPTITAHGIAIEAYHVLLDRTSASCVEASLRLKATAHISRISVNCADKHPDPRRPTTSFCDPVYIRSMLHMLCEHQMAAMMKT